MRKRIILVISLLAVLMTSCSKENNIKDFQVTSSSYEVGYYSDYIPIPLEGSHYIAGYHQGVEADGILDKQMVSAMYINNAFLISVDCIGLSIKTTELIRSGLSSISHNINVFSTHTHAGLDTLGLWGGIGLEGKNAIFMQNLVETAINVGKMAYYKRQNGRMYFGSIRTEDIQEDSRAPYVYDDNLYQFRFVGNDGYGVRLINYAAHAESLRGSNRKVSADYVGGIRRIIKEKTNDDLMFIQGAIGGLIMTAQLATPFDPETNLELTSKAIADYILDIDNERELTPKITILRRKFTTKLDNYAFMFYKFLGIVQNELKSANSMTGYSIESEISIMLIDDILVYFVPGEIFPELVYGNSRDEKDPKTLSWLAKKYEIDNVLVFGLSNDELGYIVPPSSYLLNEKAPYFAGIKDSSGENHYEETNSTSIECAQDLYNSYLSLLDYNKSLS